MRSGAACHHERGGKQEQCDEGGGAAFEHSEASNFHVYVGPAREVLHPSRERPSFPQLQHIIRQR